MKKIRYIFADIDGVLTDGTVRLDETGHESKSISYRDLDAIDIGRKGGLEFAFVTGEDTPIAHFIAQRFDIKYSIFGAKDKAYAVRTLLKELAVPAEEICYIGDSERDVPAIRLAGFGATVCNGVLVAQHTADYVTKCAGGAGALLELVKTIVDRNGEGKRE